MEALSKQAVRVLKLSARPPSASSQLAARAGILPDRPLLLPVPPDLINAGRPFGATPPKGQELED
jgi:glutamine synthetase type III